MGGCGKNPEEGEFRKFPSYFCVFCFEDFEAEVVALRDCKSSINSSILILSSDDDIISNFVFKVTTVDCRVALSKNYSTNNMKLGNAQFSTKLQYSYQDRDRTNYCR